MQYIKIALPLALATGAFANPLAARGGSDCLAAVTGKAALGDDKLRADDCKSYLATTVTAAAVTVTTTLGGGSNTVTSSQRGQVTVCPNQVPRYASACSNGVAYSSACSKFGHGSATTTTVPGTTTTITTYVPGPTGSVPGVNNTKCVTSSQADYFVNAFKDFLENTNYNGTQAPKGKGFNTALALKVLAPDFQDISDSINFLAQIPIGSVTFPSRDAFIGGQGSQPEVQLTVLNTWFNCNTITFRYRLLTGAGPNIPVVGINVMELSSDLTQIKVQYAEFNNAAWLTNLGNPECKSSGNSTASSRKML